jgi:uncharacterized protein (TIGR03083 family)
MSTAERLNLGTVYAETRARVGALVSGAPDAAAIPVPACPEWTVHDVVAHLVAVVEDVLGGRLTGIPTNEATAEQVARRAGRPVSDMVAEWNAIAPAFEAFLSSTPVWPAAMDALSHEQDIRGAIGQPGARDVPAIVLGTRRLVQGIPSPVALVVHLDGEDHRVGPETPDAGDSHSLELTTTTFEAFRFRLGRRSRAQLAALAWSGDPAPVLDHLTIFGPSPIDIIE